MACLAGRALPAGYGLGRDEGVARLWNKRNGSCNLVPFLLSERHPDIVMAESGAGAFKGPAQNRYGTADYANAW